MKCKSYLVFFSFLWMSTFFFSQEKIVNNVTIKGNIKMRNSFLKRILSIKKDGILDSISLEKEYHSVKKIAGNKSCVLRGFFCSRCLL